MTKTYLSILAGTTLVTGSASALQYQDTNPANVRLDATAGGNLLGSWIPNPFYNPSYTGQFSLLDYGFNPSAEQVDSAVVKFWLNDANGGSESYLITIEGDTVFSGGSFSTTLLGTIQLSGGVTGTLLGSLDTTGLLNYTVTANSGSFWLAQAQLTAETSLRPASAAPVPETGTTAVLLGLGLLALVGLERQVPGMQRVFRK